KDVQISSAERVFKGRAVDIDSDGALIVELSSGERRAFRAGDVAL
ncbi:MAG: bifunctional biotin--[acetyl-CoA-carboxylase] synthetase/biotin operon repressor, partial [Actinomycetia bacterium]|nr:bifunctional biotin--[acetyl-CoA-carboxylase] synthetase/biotin operon repressor [Actinomycetes bacterium]